MPRYINGCNREVAAIYRWSLMKGGIPRNTVAVSPSGAIEERKEKIKIPVSSSKALTRFSLL